MLIVVKRKSDNFSLCYWHLARSFYVVSLSVLCLHPSVFISPRAVNSLTSPTSIASTATRLSLISVPGTLGVTGIRENYVCF